jgi:hypothetical protein
LKIIKDLLLIPRINECRERHASEFRDVIILIRAVRGIVAVFAFQCGPLVLPEDDEIGNPLDIGRIVLQDYAIGEHHAKFTD